MIAYSIVIQLVMWTLILTGIFTKNYYYIPLGWAVGISYIVGVWIMGRMEFGSWTWWRN